MHKKIAFAKTGWSDFYQGGPVLGRFEYIREYEEAHEKFNFLQTPDGNYCGYVPPIGSTWSVPKPTVPGGWLVVFVSARDGKGPLTVVGWYEDATFAPEYLARPEYETDDPFETDARGQQFLYCISARRGYLIPPDQRSVSISGAHFRRSPILYVRGSGRREPWREDLAQVAEDVVRQFGGSSASERGKFRGQLPVTTPEHRAAVEKAAVDHVRRHLRSNGYKVINRESEKCGYDLLAKRSRAPAELHVEVKGTSLDGARFYMTRNEMAYRAHPNWRLALVTSVLSHPKLRMLKAQQVESAFVFEPVTWVASARNERL
jgi:hypothetical protein